jgi:hypothetical protein
MPSHADGLFGRSTRPLFERRDAWRARGVALVAGVMPNAPSEPLGDEFQDFGALAINVHCSLAHPRFLRLCFGLNCLGYRFVEQDLYRVLSCQDALFDQCAIERDRRTDGRHVVSRVMECVHRPLNPAHLQTRNSETSLKA